MSLVEELHAARKARLERMAPSVKAPTTVSLDQYDRLEAKFYRAQALISDLEAMIVEQRAALKAFAEKSGAPIISDVVAVVSRHFNMPKHAPIGKGRSLPVTQARHVAQYLCRKFGYSFPQIGRAFGRHHTSAIHGTAKATIRAKDANFAALLRSLESEIIEYAAQRAGRRDGVSE